MVIQSLLDTDLYKFSMMQVVLHHFPGATVEYRFKCRSRWADLAPFLDEIRAEVRNLCSLRFRREELEYLRGLRFLKSDFIDLLRLFQLEEGFIDIQRAPDVQGGIDITIRGPWLHTIFFEVPVLAIVSEVYFRNMVKRPDEAEGLRRLDQKIALVRNYPEPEFRISDFGTRRRFSHAWQARVVEILKRDLGPKITGTSNVFLARKLGMIPLGTMAHEYLQACQAVGPRLRDSQRFAFDKWAEEYRGDLGIALTDVCGMDAFLRDFDLFFCKLFDGVRHDSGDPFEWGEKMIAHYEKMRVDPRTKTFVFSDSLNVPLSIKLYERFKGRCRPAFGLGTNLTNDLGYDPLQIVIKMTRCNGQPVAKISDTPEKTMDFDPSYLAYLREVFAVPEPVPESTE
ncbi:MAG: nicotinate phosphoribosyltransferase [Burkholderiales bacterium]|jgi:nicotinate phosphoribosyltransferase|nr:nicotinate phosphoribosyltransferase [Burkholderiales bacterium]